MWSLVACVSVLFSFFRDLWLRGTSWRFVEYCSIFALLSFVFWISVAVPVVPYHITSNYIRSFCIISDDSVVISSQTRLKNATSARITSCQFVSYHFIPLQIISDYIMLCHRISAHVISLRNISFDFISLHIISCRFISCYDRSYCTKGFHN